MRYNNAKSNAFMFSLTSRIFFTCGAVILLVFSVLTLIADSGVTNIMITVTNLLGAWLSFVVIALGWGVFYLSGGRMKKNLTFFLISAILLFGLFIFSITTHVYNWLAAHEIAHLLLHTALISMLTLSITVATYWLSSVVAPMSIHVTHWWIYALMAGSIILLSVPFLIMERPFIEAIVSGVLTTSVAIVSILLVAILRVIAWAGVGHHTFLIVYTVAMFCFCSVLLSLVLPLYTDMLWIAEYMLLQQVGLVLTTTFFLIALSRLYRLEIFSLARAGAGAHTVTS